MKKLTLILVILLMTSVYKGIWAQSNPNANPKMGEMGMTQYPVFLGDTALLYMDLLNTGSDPIPAGGAKWNINVPIILEVDTNSINYGYNTPGQASSFKTNYYIDSPSNTTYIIIWSDGVGLAAAGSTTGQDSFRVSLVVKGGTVAGPLIATGNASFFPSISGNSDANDDNNSTPVWVSSNPNPSSLELLKFYGYWDNPFPKLEWSVANEKDNAYFIVERSTDAMNFEPIGNVASIGDHELEYTYSYDDQDLIMKENMAVFYRMKQVDMDGIYTYSELIHLTRGFHGDEEIQNLKIFPSPVAEKMNVVISSPDDLESERPVYIMDMMGRIVTTKSVPIKSGKNIYQIDVANLTPGTYFAVYTSDLGKMMAEKFIKL